MFADDAPLSSEFEELYASLFDNHSRHLRIVEALAEKQSGLTRNELIAKTKFPSGGNMATILTELEQTERRKAEHGCLARSFSVNSLAALSQIRA